MHGLESEAAFFGGHSAAAVVFGAFVAMGALTGLAALLHSVRFASVDPTAGTGLELQGSRRWLSGALRFPAVAER